MAQWKLLDKKTLWRYVAHVARGIGGLNSQSQTDDEHVFCFCGSIYKIQLHIKG